MSTTHNPKSNATRAEPHQREAVTGAAQPGAGMVTDDWVPEDRAPSAAESNFLSFALFGFLILFGIGCIIFL